MTVTSPRPSVRFLVSRPAHFIALGAGSGLAPVAPGTIGTLWAWLVFVWLRAWLPQHTGALHPDALMGLLIALGVLVGWWACSVTARDLGDPDPSSVVWDEVIAFWIVLWLIAPAGFFMQFAAFVLFRFFDASKIGPVGWADALFKPRASKTAEPPPLPRWNAVGWGIIFDDLVAALCTLLVIALLRFWALT
ncbi:MAG: phosphatidylglycerophosphatase A [Burkholderiaceae bacterium]|jgi:phosphatidylglycerophosphatase A|nr:phosphatidylglycerophosphatase A [Burkholderiaceae bacterium]